MSISMAPEGNNVYRLEMTGLLRKADLDRSQVELVMEMRRVGSVKLLCVLKDFQGWEPHSGWNDLTFYVQHGGAIDRIAIVGDEQWRTEALMFTAAGLRRGPVQYFTGPEIEAARTWLAA
jgi:hypothetical protein